MKEPATRKCDACGDVRDFSDVCALHPLSRPGESYAFCMDSDYCAQKADAWKRAGTPEKAPPTFGEFLDVAQQHLYEFNGIGEPAELQEVWIDYLRETGRLGELFEFIQEALEALTADGGPASIETYYEEKASMAIATAAELGLCRVPDNEG